VIRYSRWGDFIRVTNSMLEASLKNLLNEISIVRQKRILNSRRPHQKQELVGLLDQRFALGPRRTDCAARMLAIARALPSSFVRALRSPPDSGVG
jgi:hypothetical protein